MSDETRIEEIKDELDTRDDAIINLKSVSKITEAVTAKAKHQVELMQEITEDKIAQIEKETEEQVNKIHADAKKYVEETEAKNKENKDAIDNIYKRLDRLNYKQEVITRVLNEAREKLENETYEEKHARYISFLPDDLHPGSKISPAKDETDIIKSILIETNLDHIEILPEGQFIGGFMIVTEDYILDKSYRTVFRQEEDSLRKLAATILFEEGN